MRTQGVKLLDPVLETSQLWLIIPKQECPDEAAELNVVAAHFRVPHEAWGLIKGFVQPVKIRRSRRRVLFSQESGVQL